MLFQRAAVIGIGLIGGSFALAARQAGLVGTVVGVARSPATLDLARERGAADEVTTDPQAAVAGADLVYLAAPVGTICEHLRTLGPHLAPGALVTDAGSTKAEIVAAARALPPPVTFLGGHPMAGSEQAGMAAARADLLTGSRYFLTPEPHTPPEAVERLTRLVEGLGARPLLVAPEEHDRLVAVTSHLPHLAAWALCAAAGQTAEPARLAPFTAGGWRDTTRVADSPEQIWADIFLSNAENLDRSAAALEDYLRAVREALRKQDREALLRLLAEARALHRRIAES